MTRYLSILFLVFNVLVATIAQPLDGSIPYSGKPLSAIKSTANSSTTTLLSGQEFTGTWEQNTYPDVMVSCESDVPGILYFDFSNDGVKFSTFPVNGFRVSANKHEFHTAVKGLRHFRVRFLNGSTNQTSFDLNTYYGEYRQGNAPINQSISADSDAIIVRSISSELDLAFGNIEGMSESSKYGYTGVLGTGVTITNSASWEDVWQYGGQRTSPTTSFTPFMASTNASDNENIKWTYLDVNGLEQTVTVTLNGLTPVSLGVIATELYRGENVGSNALQGIVSATTANNFTLGSPVLQTQVLASINLENGQTQLLAGRTPGNVTRRVTHITLSLLRDSGSNGSAIAVFQTRESGSVWVTKRNLLVTSAEKFSDDIKGIILPPLTDYRIRIRDISDAGTYISGNIDFEDVEN